MSWGADATTPPIDWTMSAALTNVVRVGNDLPEVTNLRWAVEAWMKLDPEHRAAASLRPERPIMVDGTRLLHFEGDGIAALAELLDDEPFEGKD